MIPFPRQPGLRIAPSILSADFANLAQQVAQVEAAGADLLHLDVMDGHFVPNITFGPPVIKKLRPHSRLFFDAHLMIEEPRKYAETFVKAGCDHITFHAEVMADVGEMAEMVEYLHSLGVSAGVSLNPTTPADAIAEILPSVDLVLVMSVWPGFGGQAFISDVLPKAQEIKQQLQPRQRLQIDGGMDSETIGSAIRAGVDTIVAGSAIFGRAQPPAEAMATLQELARKYHREYCG